MQGSKGSLGERGGSMFYNSGSSFALSSTFRKAMAIRDDDLEDDEFKVSSIRCIPCNEVYPIVNDYFFNVENRYTSLYVVTDVIYFSITSYSIEGIKLYEDQDIDSSAYSIIIPQIIKLLGGYLETYNSVKKLISISAAEEEMFSKYPVYIIKYLDTWEYLESNPTNTDLAVTVLTRTVNTSAWNGEYKVKAQKCSGHHFDIVNTAVDSVYMRSVFDKHEHDVQEEGFTFRILDASTYLPIVGSKAAKCYLYKNSTSTDWTMGLQAYEANMANCIYSGDFIEEGLPHTLTLNGGPYTGLYMKLEINDYFTTRVFLNGASDYTFYVFKYVLSDEVLNADFELVHEYEYFDTSEPESGNDLNTFEITKFYVNSGMSSEEKMKWRIEAEFTSPFNKKQIMSTMRDTLWKVEAADENTPTNAAYPHGRPENFKYTLNFDNEDPGDFTIVIKDYNEGNDVKLYTSTMLVPYALNERYIVTIYGYYKSTSDNCSKIFLGQGEFGDTIT